MKTNSYFNLSKSIYLSLLFSFTLLVTNCTSKGKPANFDYGHIEDNTYYNSYFNFELMLPESWSLQSKEQMEYYSKIGKEFAAGDDKEMKAMLDAAEINSAHLVNLFKYEVGSPVDYNPNFMIIAENIKNAPGLKSGEDYLYQAKKFLHKAQIKYHNIDEEFESKMIGNHEFFEMNCDISYLGATFHQTYFATVINRFSLIVVISYANDDERAELEKIMNKIKFND